MDRNTYRIQHCLDQVASAPELDRAEGVDPQVNVDGIEHALICSADVIDGLVDPADVVERGLVCSPKVTEDGLVRSAEVVDDGLVRQRQRRARVRIDLEANKKEYTHTCVCTQRQAAPEAKQVRILSLKSN